MFGLHKQHQPRRNTGWRRKWHRNHNRQKPATPAPQAPHATGASSPDQRPQRVAPTNHVDHANHPSTATRRTRALEAVQGPCRARLLPFVDGVDRLYAVQDSTGRVRTQTTNRTVFGARLATLGVYEPDTAHPGFARWVAA
jgi:hypothetical protein